MTDNEIVEHLKQDKYSAAVKGLYHILPIAKKYIKSNTGNTHDAQDIFQDALVILCKKIRSGNFILTASLKSYVMAIVKNCWLQELRLRKKMPAGFEVPEISAEEIKDGSDFILAKSAFNSLGEKCRQLLILFYYRQKSFKTIAAELAFNDEKTAKNQKYRCLQKAKEHYVTLTKNGSHE